MKKTIGPRPGESLTDEQLVERVLEGESVLFEILLHRHSQQVYRSARAILRDDDEAADVLQETYLKAYRNLSQFARRAKFSTWLTRIAIYEARARRRRRKARGEEGRTPKPARPEPVSEPEAETRVLVREMKTMIEAAIDTLPEAYRTVFVMRGVEEMSTSDTAACLKISEDAVKTRFRRARVLLKKRLSASAGPSRREAFRFAGRRCERMWLEKIRPAVLALASPRSDRRP